ncbi:hypothetical protein [Actinoplanes awajinensis]|uniref:Polysaccharide chain length determinant N-terminal domain-containing protein n=1 Tax=Actinoplanes awajinensis subsp. mycoplanecinus TaxID=135947 RepID=A0A0X3V5U4_9ACTN|nr:hypothetical protein [Actinoplanes awajinensis]KUL40014.1 hypothetical protein ADL15_08170 [Actinoplanes awajinensis subsp. mycoplanecinus]
MDLWDMTKLLFRRWYLSLPMLLVTLVLVGVAAVTVKPDYSAVGHIQFIPPVGTTAKDGSKNPIDNPWWELGYEALANATVIDVTKKSVLEDMVKDGLSDNITVTIDQVPLFGIEAVGDSPEQATQTVQYVQKAIADAVARRQETLRVTKSQTITMLELDDGSEVTVKNSKIMRVMVVAGGLGLLLTAGFTIGVDALLRARARRRNEDDEPETVGSAVGAASLDGRNGTSVPPSFEATQTVIHPRATQSPRSTPAPGKSEPARPANGNNNGNGGGAPAQRRGSSDGTYRSNQGSGPAADPRLEQAPADATIVLPPWGGGKRDDKKAERR